MKFVTLALAVMALAVPATLLFTSSRDGLMVDRAARSPAHVTHAPHVYAAR